MTYVDGTTDCRSYAHDGYPPSPGEFHHRGSALFGGDYVTWVDDTTERSDREAPERKHLPSHQRRPAKVLAKMSHENYLKAIAAEKKRLFDIENAKPF